MAYFKVNKQSQISVGHYPQNCVNGNANEKSIVKF